jgi:hypothetical protein
MDTEREMEGHVPFTYCHVKVWLETGFGLVTGFIVHFDTVRDYTLQFTITHTSVHSHVFTTVAW